MMLFILRMHGVSAGIVLALTLAASPVAGEEDMVRWRMNSLLYPKLFGEAGERFAETVGRLSGGTFVIDVHDRLVLDQHTFGALESGLIDAVWGSSGHHHREDPALTIFTGFPFGPDPAEFTAWMLTGGGAEALDAIYARHHLKSLYCGILPSEGGGWFVAPVESLDDLDGMSMRSFGYGASMLRKLGVVPYELPAGEIRPALESGLIDGAEFSLPSIDAELGIADVAKHLYFPGWQQPVTSLEILMPERSWAGLSDRHKAALQTACGESLSWTAANAAMQQVEAIAAFRADGVTIHAWSDEILAALRQAWDEVIAEDVARDPLLAEAWAGYRRFREGYVDWEARAYAN
jgi:TRAP-type mannitol/chloroaromatic compound transport system substrate-binding protein